MNNLYEVLEICLKDIEQGATIDTVLFRYPDLAEELRPILEASVDARNMATLAPSAEVMRRNRARVLQHAAQLRERKVRPASRRIWFASLRRLVVTLTVIVALFVSGTSLVRASSATLPGDNLYPVKRTWEDVLLLFTFNLQERDALEVEHENERLHELLEVFAIGRFAEVEFAGVVTSQNGNEWLIAGIPVVISDQTEVRDGPVSIGSAVRVEGHAQNGIVLAERVRLLPPDAKLPDEVEVEREEHEEDNSGKGSESHDSQNDEIKLESGSKDGSSNSGSGSDNSGSESDENRNDSGNSIEDNSDSGENNDSTDSDDNSGHGSNDEGGGDNGDDSGGGDNSDSGGGDGDD